MIAGVSLVIPAFNEESAVADVVTRFRSELDATGCTYEVIVVDDGSTDATARLAKEAGASVVCSPQNLGYGLSLRRGIMAAKFDYVMSCDATGLIHQSLSENLRVWPSIWIWLWRRVLAGILGGVGLGRSLGPGSDCSRVLSWVVISPM